MNRPTLLVTRPQPQADAWVVRLSALGVDAAALPLLAIAGAPDPAALGQAWASLSTQELVMFVSPNAVQQFFAHRPAGLAAAAWPAHCLAGSTGPGTASALVAAGVPLAAIISPPSEAGQFDAEALWQVLRPRRDWDGASVLVVRGEGGRDWLADSLRAVGATLNFVAAYRRVLPEWCLAEHALLARSLATPQDHVWLFSSSQAVRHLQQMAPDANWSNSAAIATHPRIAEAVAKNGFARVHLAPPTPEAAASALTRSIQSWPP